tara:strand:+ start:2968 stop:3273 length:306 start_codon:yes stop_codon:yes gene_type:complete
MSQDKLKGQYFIDGSAYTIELSNGTGAIHLSRNTCQLNYEYAEQMQSIQFAIGGCTKVCCDNELDEILKSSLAQITGFATQKNGLVLYGKDTLQLQRKATP